MRSEIIYQLNSDEDYYYYLRENPIWHKILSIYPDRLKDFLDDYKVARKKRAIDKIDDINVLLNLADSFLKK
ncbi:MAG: hypothetical protein MR270_07685 [Erysipelotrichaceae bacterium]|nr:hypothetical protein [Erysipelotrichaceae bacterium]